MERSHAAFDKRLCVLEDSLRGKGKSSLTHTLSATSAPLAPPLVPIASTPLPQTNQAISVSAPAPAPAPAFATSRSLLLDDVASEGGGSRREEEMGKKKKREREKKRGEKREREIRKEMAYIFYL